MTNLYVDIHVLQTVPAANINRDDTGSPKTALYGGVTRARVSSQSWKHVMRENFKADPEALAGVRSKSIAKVLVAKIQELAPEQSEEAAWKKAEAIFAAAKIKLDKEHQTGALLMVSRGQLTQLAQYALANDTYDKKAVKSLLTGNQSLDLALFGRMVADNPELNVEAAAQVAHALSTHEIVPEFDYFTAMDDYQKEDTTGAAMLGTVEFNSATLYRYANLNVPELVANVGSSAAVSGALAYIKSFLLSMPTGKQNTFANKTLPNYVLVTLREDTPVNLVSAFEQPIQSKSGYVAPSVQALENEYQATQQFVDQPLTTLVLSKFDSQVGTQVADLEALLAQVAEQLKQVIPDENSND